MEDKLLLDRLSKMLEEEVQLDSDLQKFALWDSIAALEVIELVKEITGKLITSEEIENIKTPQELLCLIRKYQ